MLTFYDEKGNGYGAQVEFTTKNAVNGERSVSGTILTNEKVLSRIDRGWSFEWDGEMYKIIYAKPKDEGRSLSVSFDAVHQFFYDFDHSNCYKEFNGSNRFEVYIEEIFKDSGYRYVIEAQAGAIRKENFGNASRLKMFKDIIKVAGLEFSVTGKVVRILKKVGTDLSTVVRKNFNMNELTLEKNIGAFITYKKGLGAWKDENNHGAGRYTSEYESPLARIYGRIEGDPVTDERYKETGKLLERLKKEVDESYSISVQLEMEDLTRAGYKYKQPRAGDYIMAINETIGFREKIRIVSYESSYDVTGRLIKHKVTCNDIGTVQKAITSEGSIMRSVSESREYAEGALSVATRALVSANGKNTNYYGAKKPEDNPRGTLHEGDLLYLTVGEETELYYWSGTEWLPKILKVDTAKIEKIVNNAQISTNQAIAQADAKAEEALKKAGTLPDTSKLSEQIKQQILNSPDLQNKVTEGVESVDGDTIYSKIVSKVSRNFATKNEFDALDRVQDDMGRDLIGLSRKVTAQTLEFNKLTESNKLYERILGTSETGAPDKLSRLVMSSEIFQTEVGKYVTDDNNLIVNSMTLDKNTIVNGTTPGVRVSLENRTFSIYAYGLTSQNYTGFSLPIYVKKVYRGETYTLGFKYRFRYYPDEGFAFNIKNHGRNKILSAKTVGDNRPPLNEWQEYQQTFTINDDFEFGEDRHFPFYVYLLKNGWVEFKEPILVRGSKTGPYKPSQFDDAYKASKEAKDIASDAQTKAIQVAEQARQARQMAEAIRTQVTQLAGTYSIKNINSAGDILGQLNLNKDGSIKLNEALIAIGEKTYVKDGVIKKAMIGDGQIGTAHISEIDASKAQLINVSAKNIVSNGLTANIIKGGKLSSLNGVTDFDLQTGWIDMNNANVGIRNQFRNKPLQYLVFGQGAINGKEAAYTALMSNSWKRVAMDDGSAGIQIWNANDNTTAVNIYGDLVEFMYKANDKLSVAIDTVTNKLYNIEDIVIRGYSLSHILDDIFDNFNNLNHDGNYVRGYHGQWRG